MSNNKFRFSNRLSFVTEHGDNVFINDTPLENEENLRKDQDKKKELEQSYQHGWKACALEKDKEIQRLSAQLDNVSRALPEAVNSYLEEFENQVRGEIVKLALKIAEDIISRELEDSASWQAVIDRVLGHVIKAENFTLHLNPAMAKLVSSGEIKVKSGIEVLSDNSLEIGDVRLAGSNGIIDGTVAGRIHSLRNELNKAFSHVDEEDIEESEQEEDI